VAQLLPDEVFEAFICETTESIHRRSRILTQFFLLRSLLKEAEKKNEQLSLEIEKLRALLT